ncbi:Na+ dependent nucleoside transporter C-terminus-domain-containing protein [Phialemonium atrogriseum]|uniref:Na+ dependent nucleoside transporter C-terminus-domain-containing protein n=1 Tax=Phialemonium atrogriseum TaxID=1093897 RepID=A0AAJ0BU85_9PEZI|nr:Na+ dependent nucleoside transporter C-terminus-domain-containing protein [Phialemonium atrogriseum]KAK1763219.1 Na+ dependent nucleoside transporter C-terminus-domain-containing protein [Phialemonium atrogriseum]
MVDADLSGDEQDADADLLRGEEDEYDGEDKPDKEGRRTNIMSIPASIPVSKLRYPKPDEPLTRAGVAMPGKQDAADAPRNSLHAFTGGAWVGAKITGMMVAAALSILALLGLANGLLGWLWDFVQLIMGYLFYTAAFLLGVERGDDLLMVARLIGVKIVANEFVARNWDMSIKYENLTKHPEYGPLSPRSPHMQFAGWQYQLARGSDRCSLAAFSG